MPRKRRYSTEQIISKLREADVLLSQNRSAEEIARLPEISKQTYYWGQVSHNLLTVSTILACVDTIYKSVTNPGFIGSNRKIH
jgi:hypothetical protein